MRRDGDDVTLASARVLDMVHRERVRMERGFAWRIPGRTREDWCGR